MQEVGDKIDAADKAAVEADLKSLKDTIAKCGDDITDEQVNELKAGREKLMNSAQKLFEKVYQQTQAQAGPGAGAGPQAGQQNAGGSQGGKASMATTVRSDRDNRYLKQEAAVTKCVTAA